MVVQIRPSSPPISPSASDCQPGTGTENAQPRTSWPWPTRALIFGRHNVVRRADYVLVIGGGAGTTDEIDLAIAMGKKIVPLPASGGAARHAYQRLHTDPTLRSWLSEETFASLDRCTTASAFTTLVEQILTATPRSTNP